MRVSSEGGRAAAVKGPSRVLARRYARALLDVAGGTSPDTPRRLRSELGELVRALESDPRLAATLMHPALGREPRRRLLAAVSQQAGLSPLLQRLLELLAARDRLALLPALAEAYAAELLAEQGVVSATALSAVPLAEAERQALSAALFAVIGNRIELKTEQDPTLLGGVLVRVGGRSYDGTVRTQLQALRRRLAAGS